MCSYRLTVHPVLSDGVVRVRECARVCASVRECACAYVRACMRT